MNGEAPPSHLSPPYEGSRFFSVVIIAIFLATAFYCIPLLPYFGVAFGLVSIRYGQKAIANQSAVISRYKRITGTKCRILGIACVGLGIGLIVYVVMMVRIYPDGLGH